MFENKRSESIMNLAAALAIAQGQIKTASKDAEGNYSKYSSLDAIWDACRQPLAENGLSIVQIPSTGENELVMETTLYHSSGEWISGSISLPLISGRMNEHQALGTAITYARRYSLSSMVGIASGDDDDGEAHGKPQDNIPQTATKTPPSNNKMTLEKLLVNLDKVERIKGFYSPSSIMACRPKSAEPPAPDDTDGWRQLFVDARNYAFEQLDQVAQDELKDESPEIFNSLSSPAELE
jgi:hypothetical protein